MKFRRSSASKLSGHEHLTSSTPPFDYPFAFFPYVDRLCVCAGLEV